MLKLVLLFPLLLSLLLLLLATTQATGYRVHVCRVAAAVFMYSIILVLVNNRFFFPLFLSWTCFFFLSGPPSRCCSSP